MRNRPHTLVNEIILYRRPPIFGNAKRLLRARRTHSEYSKQMAQVDGRAEKKRRRMWKTTVINERTRVSDVRKHRCIEHRWFVGDVFRCFVSYRCLSMHCLTKHRASSFTTLHNIWFQCRTDKFPVFALIYPVFAMPK